MKKYITIAALLAAGSALANAETLTLDNAVGYLSLVDGVLTPSAENISFSNGTLSVADGYWTSFNSSSRTVSTIAMTFDAAVLADGITSSAQPLVELDGGLADWGLGLSSSGMFTGTWVYGSTTNYAYLTSGYGVSSDSTGNITVVISLGDTGTRIWEDSSTYWSNGSLKAPLDSTGNVSAINLSALAVSALNNIVVWGVDTYTNTNTDSEGVASAMATSVSLIPEPSAFGLLAGLGALALAASRRRRSR